MPYSDPERQKQAQREWVARRRREFFDDKHCEVCGTVADLELHHRDPSVKTSHRIWSWSQERREAEIAKCRIICGSCHARFHAEARRLEAELRNGCGTIQAYRRGCRCDACRAARRDEGRRAA